MKPAFRAMLIAIVGALVIWGVAAALGITWLDLRHLGEPRNVLEVGHEKVRIPAPEGPDERRLPAVPITTSGEYAFMFADGASAPVRYDPCRPLDWVLNPTGMPDGMRPLIDAAVQSVSAATGLEFRYDGTTTERVSFDRPLIQDRYGPGFAPILIGFSDERQTPELAGSVTGLGGSSAVYGAYGDERFLHSGVVILDSQDLKRLLSEPHGSALAQAVAQHEIGHVVGLAHVNDDGELMHASNLRITDWGPGDREGLAIAGDGPCEGD